MMKGYKGFDKDLKCMEFQYEVGGEYEEPEPEVKICEKGFHFCENPMEVLKYYSPSNSRYAEVEGDGKIENEYDKICCSRLRIKTEIGLTDLIQAGVKFILDKVDWKNVAETNTEDYSVATNTGTCSATTNTGAYSVATNTGDCSAAANTGNYSVATNTGVYSVATNTGDYSAATNTGYCSVATNTGEYSAATNTGYRSAATNTGYCSVATNTGTYSVAANTGAYSAVTNTGTGSAATNTGAYSAAAVEGREAVAISLGIEGKAKGALGCWLVLAEWERLEDGWHRTDVKCGLVDGVTLKPNTYYTLQKGKFVEVV